jgi:signal transduction histidine kinase
MISHSTARNTKRIRSGTTEVQPRADQFRVLTQVSRQITTILDINELLVQVVRLVQQTFGYYHVAIGLIEGDEVVYRVGAGVLWDAPDFQFKPARLKIGKEGLSGWVAATGEPLIVPDVSKEPHYVWMQGSQTRSELTVPITVKGQVIGVLDVQIDLELMQALASQAGAAIENARLFKAEQVRADQFRVISEVGRHITSILNLNELLIQIARAIREAFDYDIVEIGLIEGDELVFRAGAVRGNDSVFQNFQLKVGLEGITGWVAATGEPLLVPDVNQEPRYIQMTQNDTRSELAVPIKSKEKTIGVFNVQSNQLDAFADRDIVILEHMANQAAVAIENARLYEQVRQVATLEERQRLARELHDSVTQSLYGMTLYSQAALGQLNLGHLEQAAQNLRELQETAQEALAEMRLLIYELRPPELEKEGLEAALLNRLAFVEERAGLKTSLISELTERLPQTIEEGLYRIAREALNNVLKYAQAHTISIYLRQVAKLVTMEIVDDGVGFDPQDRRSRGGVGLLAMQERAAELGGQWRVVSQPGEGTRVYVEVPL